MKPLDGRNDTKTEPALSEIALRAAKTGPQMHADEREFSSAYMRVDPRLRRRGRLELELGYARGLKFLLLAMAFLLLAAIPLARQFATGSIEGLITDNRGPILDASVEARNLASSLVITRQSDARGHYAVEHLLPGTYSLLFEAPGYDSVSIPRVVVQAGQTSAQNVQLNPSRAGWSGL